MASTVLDAPMADVDAPATRRRPPAAVVAAAAVAVLEAVALLGLGLTGLDGLLTSPARPPGPVALAVLLGLAGWVVLCAGGGVVLVDGSGCSLLVRVAHAELALLGGGLLLTQVTTLFDDLPIGVPLPALVLMALALPCTKLLLAGAPSTLDWLAAGPRAAAPRPELTGAQRDLRLVTVAVIGLALAGLALATPVVGPADPGSPAAVIQG